MHLDIFPIYCYTDNKSLVETVNSTKFLTEKWLKVDICIIRELIEKHEVKQISWCDCSPLLAHCLTKPGIYHVRSFFVYYKEMQTYFKENWMECCVIEREKKKNKEIENFVVSVAVEFVTWI